MSHSFAKRVWGNLVAVAGLFAGAGDVSKRRQPPRELGEMLGNLAAERKRLLDVLDVLPAYVGLLTPDLRMVIANRFFRQRFGDAQGRRCYAYLFGRSEPCEVCQAYQAVETTAPTRWSLWSKIIGPERGSHGSRNGESQ
jgi:hypothetical protein